MWGKNESLRQDVIAVLASLRRHLAVTVLGMGTLLACAILAAALVHIITD